jgi:glycogen phosphorylase
MTDLKWKMPARITRLEELAGNMWWTWHPRARELFRTLDYVLWRVSGHNPVRQLREISPERLDFMSTSTTFLTLYDSVMEEFDSDLSRKDAWFNLNYPDLLTGPVAYFSMEFAIHSSLPIYAGGLGVLAGDICKEASDLGLPMVGVGFMYPQGYFRQRISASNTQEEVYQQIDFDQAPVRPVLAPDGRRLVVRVALGRKTVAVFVWKVRVGRVDVYLLDSNVDENSAHERQLTARLYVADQEIRLQQEIILGMGGVRAIRALGIKPAIWHANEGHTAFMTLERIREVVEDGMPFQDAVGVVRSTTVFTTHTPVPAGHDVFSTEVVSKYFDKYCDSLGIGRHDCLRLGQVGSSDGHFNMSALGLRMAQQSYAVSRLHGSVARKMWQVMWPDLEEDSVPISSITNGVHFPTWVAPEMREFYERHLGKDFLDGHDSPALWERVAELPDEDLWRVRRLLRHKLINTIDEFAQKAWATGDVQPQQLAGIGALLHPDLLTIGFARRFAEYKRPTLIFHDIERLKRIIKDPFRPVQIIFAGKSHPADLASKYLVQQVFCLALDRDFHGRVAFLQDYDLHMARYLVHGVDVWLNNPRRLNEACGTSGMKAALNGVLNFSVRDGWWDEAYNGGNGWAIGDVVKPASPDEEDLADADSLYRILEKDIVPLFYTRDRNGVPRGWVRMVKESIRSVTPIFCTRRMMKQYTEQSLGAVAGMQSR